MSLMAGSRVSSSFLDRSPKLLPRTVLMSKMQATSPLHGSIAKRFRRVRKYIAKRLGQEIGLEIDCAHRNLRNMAAAMADGGGSMRAAWRRLARFFWGEKTRTSRGLYRRGGLEQIGRASCRERVYVLV